MSSINPFTLPYVAYKDKANLPASPGIYYVLNRYKHEIIYIGRARNIKNRWKNHHSSWDVVKRSRLPDVSVIAGDVWQQIPPRASAVLTVPLLLAVEVISPDYRTVDTVDKLREYQAVGIPEYWTVDWDTNTPNVTVRLLVDGQYQETVFTGSQQIVSRTFPELALTVEQVLSA